MTVHLRYGFAVQWKEHPGGHPADNEYAQWAWFASEAVARHEHRQALTGHWLQAGQHTGSVTDLYESRWTTDAAGKVVQRPTDRSVAPGGDVTQERLPYPPDFPSTDAGHDPPDHV